ncbi:MAG TPA: hypothetical protein VGN57_16675 [Pirellulaceae bacterium]|jgi:hypothetical protein|nr:hypothetical protein [Pirellulaceae bacterium]
MESLDLRILALTAFVVLALFGLYRSWRRMSGAVAGMNAIFSPSREFVLELQEAIGATQREAAANALFDSTATNRSPREALDRVPQALRDRQTRTIAGAARLVYAIEWDREGYLHVLSTSLLDPASAAPENCAAASAAHVAMLILTQQLEDAGIESAALDQEAPVDSRWRTAVRERDPAALIASNFSFRLRPSEHEALLAVDPPWPPGIPER